MTVANTIESIGSNSHTAAALNFELGRRYMYSSGPASHSGDLAAKFPWSQQQAIVRSFGSAKDRAHRAIAAKRAGNHAEAIRLWRFVFGHEFEPTAAFPGSADSSAGSSAESAYGYRPDHRFRRSSRR